MKTLWNKKFQILFFIFFLCAFLYGIKERDNLKKRKKVTIGTITGTKFVKGKYITYSYAIDTITFRRKYKIGYSTFEGMSRTTISDGIVDKYLMNRQFPVVYDSLDFFKSDILISESDFLYYKIPYPDSLNWAIAILEQKW